jgi:glycerate 2-kinase
MSTPLLQDPLHTLTTLLDKAIERALPERNLLHYLPKPPVGRTLVLGAGKAAASMALALQKHWPEGCELSGLVVTRYGHVPKEQEGVNNRIEIMQAAHPVPDAQSVLAAQKMLALTRSLTKDDLVIALISGGGSSLLMLPVEGLSLSEKQSINQSLLSSGANIWEINCVRKHLSGIKGGRLAQACSAAKLLSLCISDVPGDDPATIASGPTVADESTCAQALEVIEKYQIKTPPAIIAALEQQLLETPKVGQMDLSKQELHIIATPRASLEAAAQWAQSQGLRAYILSDEIEGESKDVALVHAALAKACSKGLGPFVKPCVLLSGGETTVTLLPESGTVFGRGGRASEFCLSLAKALKGARDIWALAADTDGIDGVEDNAGAWVGPLTLSMAQEQGLKADDFLHRHDAYGFFQAIGGLIVTGPTFTNVNDFRAILIL